MILIIFFSVKVKLGVMIMLCGLEMKLEFIFFFKFIFNMFFKIFLEVFINKLLMGFLRVFFFKNKFKFIMDILRLGILMLCLCILFLRLGNILCKVRVVLVVVGIMLFVVVFERCLFKGWVKLMSF